ncbi:TM10C-like protein [Mya arenaria]|uniref:TM10C-like protein n=1 Tax=Mya arenaria TaxID=6604 RepID=A0ABY7FW93_MYAAR|nr:uncharacterized protein LOC128218094 [Mya arenaria]WAR26265.1 TM10C-like protein [Mya arenaria]
MQRYTSLRGFALGCNRWTPVATLVRNLVDGKLLNAEDLLRMQKAIQFVSRLDAKQLERKKTIEVLHSQLLHSGELVPEELSTLDLHHMLTKCGNINDCHKYLYSAYVMEQKFKKKQTINTEMRLNLNQDPPLFRTSGQYRIVKSLQGFLHGPPVVFDLGYDLNPNEAYQVYLESMQCAEYNLHHPQPLHLHFTSFKRNQEFRERFSDDSEFETDIRADFQEASILDLYKIHSKLIYLSPDGPPLKRFSGKETFIIGGISSRNKIERLSYGKAQELGIRCASFPNRFKKWEGHKHQNLSLLEVFKVLNDVHLCGNWEQALLGNLHPSMFQRKKSKEISKTVTIEV